MPESRYVFTPPANRFFRWLVDPGAGTPPRTARLLLGELFASPKTIIAAVVNGLILNAVALCIHHGRIFVVFMVLEIVVLTARLGIVHTAIRASRRGQPTPTALYLIIASSWCALQGATAFVATQTKLLPLQLLSASTVFGLVGPICARNYAAPRFALLLVGLCVMPFIAGAALSGDRWLLVLVLQTPIFWLGTVSAVKRFQTMAMATLRAEQESHHHARHDILTGLLNRFGLMETETAESSSLYRRSTLFFLDLDGFKPINDNFGHQVGDDVLRAVAHRLVAGTRPSDIVARLGGDEFVILAPGMAPTDAEAFAERMIGRINNEPLMIEGIGELRIGTSIGFASTPEDGGLGEDLHRKADAALYEAKAAGKGVWRRFTPSPAATPALFRADLRRETVMGVHPDTVG